MAFYEEAFHEGAFLYPASRHEVALVVSFSEAFHAEASVFLVASAGDQPCLQDSLQQDHQLHN